MNQFQHWLTPTKDSYHCLVDGCIELPVEEIFDLSRKKHNQRFGWDPEQYWPPRYLCSKHGADMEMRRPARFTVPAAVDV